MLDKPKKIFISGRISGLDYMRAKSAFDEAERMIIERGDIPINPTRICSPDMTWRKCMGECIKALVDCESIYMLKGWRSSRGSRLEHFIALKLQMRVEVQK